MNNASCGNCRYKHRMLERKKIPGYGCVEVGPSYLACYFLPYWGKRIESISRCPRYNDDGSENEWTLRSVCHVNDR